MGRFDEIINRDGTVFIKHGLKKEFGLTDDVLAMWVADMDFRSPDGVREGLKQIAENGMFGYAAPKQAYFDALISWNERRHHFHVEKDWVVRTPGVVTAVTFGVKAFTEPGDAVMVMNPVYAPFFSAVEGTGRRLVRHELSVGEDNRMYADFERMDREMEQENVKAFILCSPHNPGGRVWSFDELKTLDALCEKHGVIMISDEIHNDFVYSGHTHTVYANVSEHARMNSIICTAPSKTFNVAGLAMSNIIIPNPTLKEKFEKALGESHVGASNLFGLEACRLCYETGEAWLDELLPYLEENVRMVKEAAANWPKVRLVDPDGTYLLWLDLRAVEPDHEKMNDRLLHEAKVWLNDGTGFGGEGWFRLNIGCPHETLAEALRRMDTVLR